MKRRHKVNSVMYRNQEVLLLEMCPYDGRTVAFLKFTYRCGVFCMG